MLPLDWFFTEPQHEHQDVRNITIYSQNLTSRAPEMRHSANTIGAYDFERELRKQTRPIILREAFSHSIPIRASTL